jgi:DNA-binding MarR family transcriptional regulator
MEENLGFFIADAGRLMRKRFDAASRGLAVTGTQWRVLVYVHRFPGINQGQLAERLEVEPITTCRMVDRLEQAGLLERRRNPEDRRAWNLILTDAALPLIDEVRRLSDHMVAQAVAGFTPEEKVQLMNLVERMRANLLDNEAFEPAEMHHG